MENKATIERLLENDIPNNGLIKIYWWGDSGEPNKLMISKKPIWEILNAHQVFLLCCLCEVIEVDEKLIKKHFEQIS